MATSSRVAWRVIRWLALAPTPADMLGQLLLMRTVEDVLIWTMPMKGQGEMTMHKPARGAAG